MVAIRRAYLTVERPALALAMSALIAVRASMIFCLAALSLAADYANMGNAWSKLANKDEASRNWQQAKALYEAAGKVDEVKIVADLLGK